MPKGDHDHPESVSIARRRLLFGGAAAGIAAASAQKVEAAPVIGGTSDGTTGVQPLSSPITSSIGSAPLAGYMYRNVAMYDFFPFDPTARKTWGSFGVYPAGSATAMRASVDIPAGALLGDVEYYLYNAGSFPIFCDTYLYVPGRGGISSVGANVSVPGGVPKIVAARAAAASNGPYPLGCKLFVSTTLPSDRTAQINGARVGFRMTGGEVGIRPTPARVYDSRTTGGMLNAGETRAVTLPQSLVLPGIMAVTLNVITLSAPNAGALRVYGGPTAPTSPTIYYPASISAEQQITVPVWPDRVVRLYSGQKVHIVLDIVGTVG